MRAPNFSSLLALGLGLFAIAPQGALAKTCTFTSASKAIKEKTSCSTIILKNIAVPAGETLDMTHLKKGTKVIFEGTTTFGYKQWKGPLISFSGEDIHISGASGHLINGRGEKWWDGKGTNGGKKKPKFFYAHHLKNSVVSGLHIKNTPVQGFSINHANNVQFLNIHIDNSAGDKNHGGHNTDAFDIGSSERIYIKGAVVKNQDDCLAINSGTDITFTGGYCSGGHGLSIGSVGGRSDNTVKNVLIESSTVSNSRNGVRVKTISGKTGSVSHVTFKDIKLQSIEKYGIVIRQDYKNGSPTGKPTSGVPITHLTVDNVHGSVHSKATDVLILCGNGACSDWSWEKVSVYGGKKGSCKHVPRGASC